MEEIWERGEADGLRKVWTGRVSLQQRRALSSKIKENDNIKAVDYFQAAMAKLYDQNQPLEIDKYLKEQPK